MAKEGGIRSEQRRIYSPNCSSFLHLFRPWYAFYPRCVSPLLLATRQTRIEPWRVFSQQSRDCLHFSRTRLLEKKRKRRKKNFASSTRKEPGVYVLCRLFREKSRMGWKQTTDTPRQRQLAKRGWTGEKVRETFTIQQGIGKTRGWNAHEGWRRHAWQKEKSNGGKYGKEGKDEQRDEGKRKRSGQR